MAKFLFITQSSRTTTYDGPSGERYLISINTPFEVHEKQDIKYFEKFPQRFKRVGLLEKVEIPKQKDPDVELREELEKIKGLTKKTVDKLVKIYFNKKVLIDDLEANGKIDPSITKKQKEILKKYILKGR